MHALRRAAGAATLFAIVGASTLISAGSVAAADPPATYTLDPLSCSVSDIDGNLVPGNVVPAGSDIVIFDGWFAKTRGQVQGFANNVTWVLTVNDQVVDLTPDLSGVIGFGSFWFDIFAYDAGTLAAGQELDTHYDNVLKSASFDGFDLWRKGSVYGGGADCTVTVAP